MEAMRVDFNKYMALCDESFFAKKGKIVNVIGLSIESAGPDSKLGDVCYIYPDDPSLPPIMAEVVGFKEGRTQLTPYDKAEGISIGCIVENTGNPLTVNVSVAVDYVYNQKAMINDTAENLTNIFKAL